jgi:hypothetical protein
MYLVLHVTKGGMMEFLSTSSSMCSFDVACQFAIRSDNDMNKWPLDLVYHSYMCQTKQLWHIHSYVTRRSLCYHSHPRMISSSPKNNH